MVVLDREPLPNMSLGILQPMSATTFELEQAMTVLSRTPAVLDDWLRGLPAPWTDCNEGPETFSPFEVVGHLIHGERTDWMARGQRILEDGEQREFEAFDRFAHRQACGGKRLDHLLDEFSKLRGANLTHLRVLRLDSKRLSLRGRHPTFGSVTLRQLLSTRVVHDLGHIGQIARVMSKRYSEEVGPWREFLPVLRR